MIVRTSRSVRDAQNQREIRSRLTGRCRPGLRTNGVRSDVHYRPQLSARKS
jgi:hypothetical protein